MEVFQEEKVSIFHYLPPKLNHLPPILPPKNTGSKRIGWEPSGNTNAAFNTVYSV